MRDNLDHRLERIETAIDRICALLLRLNIGDGSELESIRQEMKRLLDAR